MYTYNERIIRAGRGWTDANGVKHPTNWMNWDDATKTAMGLVWVDDPAPFDNRFYWSAGNAKDVADLKTNAIAQVKVTAGSLLAPTDWMVIKAAEVSGYTVPSEITTYRAAVRTASNTIETAINGAADHAAFMALYDVPVDADGNPTGNAPINDWPET